MISGIYGILHIQSGRWYVGWSHDILKRWRIHRNSARVGEKTPLYEALRSSGLFIWMMLELCGSDDALKIEENWIAKLKAYPDGFNRVPTSAIAPSKFDEVRRKIGAANRAKFVGEGNPFFGKKHSAASLKLIRETARNRLPEWQNRLSVALRGRKLSYEQRLLLKGSRNCGTSNPFYGRRHSEVTRRLMSLSQKKGERAYEQELVDGVIHLRKKGLGVKRISILMKLSKGGVSRTIKEAFGNLPKGGAGRKCLLTLRTS